MAQLRDSKGRFVKANNENNNMKENNTMTNRTNAKDQRMETLKANGINVENFFDLSLRIPLGADVRISVNGKEMTIGQPTRNKYNGLLDNVALAEPVYTNNGVEILEDDQIARNIIENGYVKNTKLWRRWVTAQTFSMINYKSWRNPERKGWEACMKDRYDYNYQYSMLLEEIRVLSILQKEDIDSFKERSVFFNGDVVVYALNDYFYRLKKYISKQMRDKKRCYKGEQYVKLARYGSVLVKDLEKKIYCHIKSKIAHIEQLIGFDDYEMIYGALKDFMDNLYNKLPHDTTKSQSWKDAFKGNGAYYTLLNLVRFHNCFIPYDGRYYYGANAEVLMTHLLKKYKSEPWKFHNLLLETIKANNFDLTKSIREKHHAPGSSMANKYGTVN